MCEDWKQCTFGHWMIKGNGDHELCPCQILSKIDNKFVKVRFYILIIEKRKLVDVIVKTTTSYWESIDNWDYTKDWLSKGIQE